MEVAQTRGLNSIFLDCSRIVTTAPYFFESSFVCCICHGITRARVKMGFHLRDLKRDYSGSEPGHWHSLKCGHCDDEVTAFVVATNPNNKWLFCPKFGKGSVYIRDENIYPGVKFGPNFEGLTEEVKEAYSEARNCMSVNAFTACELICREIIMHVAVDKGSEEGEPFEHYVTYLQDEGFITPPIKKWVDLIRKHGNIATHKLIASDKNRSESTLMFTAELLRLIYEMEYVSKKYTEKVNSK